jgi:DNA-binding GntR family transcriptional regulator
MIGVGAAMIMETQSDPRSLTEKAYDLLVRKITRLELAPGAALADKALVESLNIGRTPIREALQRLSAEGLVVHLPNRGMFVSEINASNALHIYEFRALIDGQAARLAALRASDKDIRDLLSLHLQLAETIDADNVDEFVDCDRRFYAALARAAQNIYLGEVIPRIFNLHLRLWFLISEKLEGWHKIARAHAEMTRGVVDAIERGDPDEAELAVKIYIHGRHKEIRELL